MTESPTLFLLGQLSIGGSERKTVRIVNALHQRGLNVHLGYLNGPDTLLAEIAPSVPVVCLDRRGKFSWPALRRLESYVETQGIARIVCINLYPFLYASVLRLTMGRIAPACVVSVNTTYFFSAKQACGMLLYTPLLWQAERIVFGCDFQRRHWQAKYRLASDKCRYIYNGVDDRLFSAASVSEPVDELRASFGFAKTDFVVGTVGQLRPEKHQRDLVTAVHRLRQQGIPAKALLVGSGPEEGALRRLIAELSVEDAVVMAGELTDVRPALLASDVFVLTSLSETFSNAALEAMAMARPVILSDAGGAREMVDEGGTGFLFPPGDVEKLVDRLAPLARDAATGHRMGQAARSWIEEKFSFSRMVDGFEALLQP